MTRKQAVTVTVNFNKMLRSKFLHGEMSLNGF